MFFFVIICIFFSNLANDIIDTRSINRSDFDRISNSIDIFNNTDLLSEFQEIEEQVEAFTQKFITYCSDSFQCKLQILHSLVKKSNISYPITFVRTLRYCCLKIYFIAT